MFLCHANRKISLIPGAGIEYATAILCNWTARNYEATSCGAKRTGDPTTFIKYWQPEHKAIVSLLYSSGLWRQELIDLEIKDILSDRMQVHVRATKGGKDRYTILFVKALQLPREYYLKYRPHKWLFEGPQGSQYRATSLKNILNAAVTKRE